MTQTHFDEFLDGTNAVLREERGPRVFPRVVLGCTADAGRGGEAKGGFRESFRNRWRVTVELCELLS